MHQSNGQSDLLSRSWNRIYLMGAAEKVRGPESSLRLQGRIWKRLHEVSVDDENPDIENYVGRAELNGTWQINKANTLGRPRCGIRCTAKPVAQPAWLCHC